MVMYCVYEHKYVYLLLKWFIIASLMYVDTWICYFFFLFVFNQTMTVHLKFV